MHVGAHSPMVFFILPVVHDLIIVLHAKAWVGWIVPAATDEASELDLCG